MNKNMGAIAISQSLPFVYLIIRPKHSKQGFFVHKNPKANQTQNTVQPFRLHRILHTDVFQNTVLIGKRIFH